MSERMSQADIDALIASMTDDEVAPATPEAPAAAAAPADAPFSVAMSQAEVDALIAAAAGGPAAPPAPPAPARPTQPEPEPSSGPLSQADIDALIAGASSASEPISIAEPADLGPITQAEVDALLEAARKRKEQEAEEAYAKMPPVPVQAAPLPPNETAPAREEPAPAPPTNAITSLLMDINLTLTVELGRARMPLKQVLSLGPGSVITLENHLASAPVNVLVNNLLVMKADVVVIGENYGIRVTESSLGGQKAS